MTPKIISALSGLLTLPTLAALLLVYLALSYLTTWYRLRHIPAPWLAHFSYLWMFRVALTGRQAQIYSTINKKYPGPPGFPSLARIGPNDLITSSPELIRRMSAARSPYGRSSWYTAMRMDPYDNSLFSTVDTAVHDQLKAKMAGAYGGKENPQLEADIDGQLAGFIRYIRDKYVSTEGDFRPMDFARAANYFTLDAVTKIAYGQEFGYLDTDSDVHGYIAAAEEQVPTMVVLAEIPFLGRILQFPWVLKQIGPKKTDRGGMGKMLAVAEKVVAERFAPDSKDRKDMLGAFVRHGVSQRQCETEALFQIIAGSDTTATAIRSTMLYLLTTPHAYTALQHEIDTAISAGTISTPITPDEARRLPYLQAVVYEGLRMHVPFSGLVMKQAPPGGDVFAGVHIPGGVRVAHNTLALQRLPEVFGGDAALFRPERWLGLEGEPERRAGMVGTVELVFGYGRWGCAGKPVAFMELNKVYVELLRNFDFQIVDPLHPWESSNHNMFFQSDMWVKVTERKSGQR